MDFCFKSRYGQTCFLKQNMFIYFLIVLIFLGCLWTLQKCNLPLEQQADSQFSEEDWFEANITAFIQSSASSLDYVVLRKTTVTKHGDFACSNSVISKACSYNVNNLVQAAQICNYHGDTCRGFVLEKDMRMFLKHNIRTMGYSQGSVLLVKRPLISGSLG